MSEVHLCCEPLLERLNNTPDKLGAGLGQREQPRPRLRGLGADADPTHPLHPLVGEAVLLHRQGEVVSAVLPYVERDEGVGRSASGVCVKEAVEEGGLVGKVGGLDVADLLQRDGGDGGAHSTEVRQVAQSDVQ